MATISRIIRIIVHIVVVMITLAAIVFFVMFGFGCTKQTIGENHYTFDRYEMIIDWYSLDTTRVIKAPAYRQVFDSIWKAETRMAFDTLPDMWYIDCNMLEVRQHLYYKKNGIKIQPSAFPKN